MTDQPRIATASDFPDQATIYLPEYTFWDTQAGACEVGVPGALLPGLRDAIDKHLGGHASEHPEAAPACGEECAEGHTYTGRCAQTPVPYCGAYSPPLHIGGEPLIRLRCTLPVGHDHHHSDSHGTRWDNPRTAPDNPAASNNEGTCGYVKPHLPHQYMRLEVLGECPGVEAAGGDGLREQYAAAMREHYLITNRDEADADGNMPCRCGDWREGGDADEYDWDHHLAEAVLAVRDRRMEQLAAGRATWKAKAEEIERDRLLAESPWLRASDEDRQTAETALAMQKGISADLRVESRARGEKLAKAEATVTRVIELTEQWATAGAPPLGTSISRWWDRRLAELRATITQPAGDGPADTTPPAEEHAYLSTGCLHGEHGYCQSNTGSNGAKVPATCKFCAAPCRCECHQQPSPVKEN